MDHPTIAVAISPHRSASRRLHIGFFKSIRQPCGSKIGGHFFVRCRSLKAVLHKGFVLLAYPGKEGTSGLGIYREPCCTGQNNRYQETSCCPKIFVGSRMPSSPDNTLHFAFKLWGELMVALLRKRQGIKNCLICLCRSSSQHFICNHSLPSFSYSSFNLFLARWSSLDAAAWDIPSIAATSFTL